MKQDLVVELEPIQALNLIRGPIWVNLNQTGSAGVDTLSLTLTRLNGHCLCNKFSSCCI